MKVRLNKNSKGVLKTNRGEYHRVVENSTHIFFVNYKECDENAQVMIFDRQRNLISDNYFAFAELTRVLEVSEYSWISKDLKNIWEENKDIW
jgi:hypothetical protein